jgi:hypothetical protein
MSKHIFSLALALGFLGAASVYAQQPQPRETTPPEGAQSSGQVQPGKSPTDNATPPPYSTEDPRPATSQSEGTAADRTPPGRTPTTTDPAAARGQQMGDQSGRGIVGASVISEKKQAPVGRVVDVVFSASNQPEFVVIESQGKTVAVPYSVANANMSANKITIDESRLQAAPKVKQGEWRSKTEGTWKKDATRYWERDQG